MIRSILYLITSRPEMFSVCLRARFLSSPREVHLTIVKTTFRYLKGVSNLGLCYKTRENFSL